MTHDDHDITSSADVEPEVEAPVELDSPGAAESALAPDSEPATATEAELANDSDSATEPHPDDEPGSTLARPTIVLPPTPPTTLPPARPADDAPADAAPATAVAAAAADAATAAAAADAPAAEKNLPSNPLAKRLVALPSWAAPAALAAVVIAALAIVLACVVLPPALSDEQILHDANAPQLAAETHFTSSPYASNDAYAVESLSVLSNEPNGSGHRVAAVRMAFVNDSFRVTVDATVDYEVVGRAWVPHDSDVTLIRATPVAGVDAAKVEADASTILAKVPSHDGVSLAQLYEGGELEVTSSTLSDDAKTSVATISARHVSGLYAYEGTLTATFAFREGEASVDAGSWQLSSVTATDDSYQRVMAPLAGVWEGTLSSSSTSSMIVNRGRCTAAEKNPLQMDVTSYDADSGRMTCDLTFVSHNHGAIPEDVAGTDGDAVVTLRDVTILLDPKTLEGEWAPASSDRSQGAYRLSLANDGGVWKARVTSGVAGSDGFLAIGYTNFTDVYVLDRSYRYKSD